MRFWFSNFRLKKAIQIFKPFCLFRNQRVVNRLLCQEKINGYGHYSNFKQIFSIGLGYKNFILNGKLYILVGDCNYIIFTVPTTS